MAAASPTVAQAPVAATTLVEPSSESAVQVTFSSLQTTTRTPLPLTTIYTPPPSCSSIVTWDGTALWQYGVNQTGGDCYPPGFHSIFDSYYTPGICPHAWTSAGTVSHSSGFDAMCCPKSFFLSAHSGGYACASIFSNVLHNVYSTFEAGNEPIPTGVSLTSVNPNNGALTVTADVIQVQWQNKDQKIISLLSAQTASATSTGAPKTGSRQTAPTPAVTEAPVSSQSSSSGLSTGAKAGIGVAVPLVVLALLGIGLFFFLRRRKAQVAQRDQEAAEKRQPAYHELAQYDQNGKEYPKPENQPPQEMDAAQPNELPADGPTAEIGGREMQRSSTFKESAIKDSQYKDRAFQEEIPQTPTKKILR